MKQVILVPLILLLNAYMLFPQENVDTVTVKGTQYISVMSPEAAFDLAVENALTNAKQLLGIEVSSFSMLAETESQISARDTTYNEVFTKYIKTQTIGKILDYEILDSLKVPEENTNRHFWEITLKAVVAKDSIKPAFDFVTKLGNNELHYNDGDEISLEVKSSKDCYLYIFHIFDIHKAVIWLPDEKWFQSNFLKANITRIIPAVTEVPIEISITEGRDMEINHVMVVATNKNIGFVDAERPDNESYYETDLFRINKWLLDWDKNVEKVEYYLPFIIHAKEDVLFKN